jgi:nucleotide-binding universal stress UspA family protein
MKTFIVPTDFSDTSKNAAMYAVQLVSEVKDARIILYHVFDKIFSGADGSPLTDEPTARRKIMELALKSMKTEMLLRAEDIDISYVAEEENSFIDSLKRFAQANQADLIIIGITGTSRMEQIVMGSNTLNIVHRNICPVMIVPPDAHFKGIKRLLYACDFKDVEKTTPVATLKAMLDLFGSEIFVVNVSEGNVKETVELYNEQKSRLKAILEGYKSEFFFVKNHDFTDAINQFAADKNIDLILTVPKKHSFLTKIFASTHTKKLVYHCHVPIVAVPK